MFFAKRKKLFCFFLILKICTFLSTSCLAQDKDDSLKATLPASLIGIWEVSGAHIDTGATHTPSYQYDDPRLTGRVITITANNMMAESLSSAPCTGITVATKRMSALSLVSDSMAGRAMAPEKPTPEDYELPLKSNSLIDVISINCKENGLWHRGLGARGGVRGAWIIGLPNGQLAIRWLGETILLLDKVEQNTKPKPSFACEKANTPVEKTICSSISLAGYDRSVATYYAWNNDAFKKVKDIKAIKRLSLDQKNWVKEKRDICGTNEKCLEHEMAERLEVLASIYTNPEWPSNVESNKK
jgi:hypothetical protein